MDKPSVAVDSFTPIFDAKDEMSDLLKNFINCSPDDYIPIDPLTIRAAYTWSDFTYTDYTSKVYSGDFDSNFLPNTPEHQAYVDVEYLFADHFLLGVSGEYLSKAYVDVTNETWIGGYALFHGRIAYRCANSSMKGEFMISVKNIGDKEYIAFTEPDPDGNSYQPAAKREIFTGLKMWV